MKPTKILTILIFAFFLFQGDALTGEEKKVIRLSWQNVVESTLSDNLSLQILRSGIQEQDIERRKAVYNFLPQLTYRASGTKNIERPEFVFNVNGREQRFIIGSRYNIFHSLNLNIPLYLGGSRFVSLKVQKNLKKSLIQELKGKESDTVLLTLNHYFQALLNRRLIQVNTEAHSVARENFRQVQSATREGVASKLDLLRAKARLSSTLPDLLSARNNFKLALQQLKLDLNIPPADSLMLEDSLHLMSFSNSLKSLDKTVLLETARKNRPEIKTARWALEAAGNQKKLRLSSFFPDIIFSGSLQQQAQVENLFPGANQYTRIKRVAISIEWPLFQSGQRFLNYQKALIETKKFGIQKELIEQKIAVEVHQAWFNYQDAKVRLQSLRDAKNAAEESLRTANLFFREGQATQLDVVTAQLEATRSKIKLLRGIFDYNVSQLNLLHASGRLDAIWE